ncbi:glycosyltransferase family 4 protein [Chitinophagaceae bacterium 26-R-25]|nr:glycosyltransferase family 4 protein [Chitinophagaceae bacterium 26-R-25]
MQEQKRLVYFLSHPIQYISPLLKELATESDLQVYYFSDASIKGGKDAGFGVQVKWDVPLLEGYKSTFIPNKSKKETLDNKFWELINPSVIKILKREPGDVIVVHGWSYASVWMTILAGKWYGKKIWLRAESPYNQEIKKSKRSLFLKRIIFKNFLFKMIDKCLYIGKESKKFFEYYGVPEKKLLYTPYCVNNAFFQLKHEELKNNRDDIKKELNLPLGKKIILYSGKYIPKKNPLDLIKAYEKIGSRNAALVMVGEGELRKEMEAYIQQHNLSDVYLTGFINQSSIPKYYEIADVFVMCSGMEETWGLSVNEAMNFAKPVVVADTVGCSADLVKNGENGFVFEEKNIENLAGCINKLISDEAFCISAGNKSKEIIMDYSNSAIVRNMVEGLNNSVQ